MTALADTSVFIAREQGRPLDAPPPDDIAVSDVYSKKGAKVADLDDATLKRWQALAKPVWKDYADKNENCAKLLALAEKLL